MGKSLTAALKNEREQATDAIGSILRYYNVTAREVPEKLTSVEEVLEYLLRPYGFMTRLVILQENWRKDASGAMLTTFSESGKPVALIPSKRGGYIYADPSTGSMVHVSAASEKLFSDEAIAFYMPFPTKAMTLKDLYGYIFRNIDRPGVAADMFNALASNNINLKMISTSEIKISCLVERENANLAIKALCDVFELTTDEIAEVKGDLPDLD